MMKIVVKARVMKSLRLSIFVFSLLLSGCVSGKKFTEVSDSYEKCKADSILQANSYDIITKEKGNLILKTLSLQQDSIRKEQEFKKLQAQYDMLLQSGSNEITNIMRHIKENKEQDRKYNKSNFIISEGEINNSLDKIYTELNAKIYNLNPTEIKLNKTKLSVKLSVKNSYMFTEQSIAPSKDGKFIIDALCGIIKDRNMFNVNISSNISTTELYNKMNRPAINNILKNISVLNLSIDTLNGEKNAEKTVEKKYLNERLNLISIDSILHVKGDSLLIVKNEAEEYCNLINNSSEPKYSEYLTDSIAILEKKDNLKNIAYLFEENENERLQNRFLISEIDIKIKTQGNKIDSINVIKNRKIEKINSLVANIEKLPYSSKSDKLNIITSLIIKECGNNLYENKVISERVYRSSSAIKDETNWIEFIIKPDIERIIGEQKYKNIYD